MEIRRATILGFTLFTAGLALCGVGLWLLLSPAQYRATVRIQVESERVDIGSFLNKAPSDAYDRYFIQTEFESLQSQAVLGKVVGALNLNAEWGSKYAGGGTLTTNRSIAILKRHLNLGIARNTKLVEISFTSEDPNEAAKVANAIAGVYRDYRLEKRNQETRKGIEVLQQEFQDEEKKIQIQQTKVDLLHKELAPQIVRALQDLTNRIERQETTPDQPYWEAKRKLNQMIDFHKLLQAKIAALKIDLYIPNPTPSMVQIVDFAQPPELPAGPNRFLGAVLLGIGLFPTVGGFLMLKSSRRPVRL